MIPLFSSQECGSYNHTFISYCFFHDEMSRQQNLLAIGNLKNIALKETGVYQEMDANASKITQ